MQRKMIGTFFLILTFGCLLTAKEASAQSLGAELGVFADKNDQGSAFSLSPLFGLEIPVAEDWAVAARWGLVFTDWSPDVGSGDSTFRVGNPFVGAVYSLMDKSIKLTVGGGIGIPLASFPSDSEVASLSYLHATAIRGFWDLWLWRSQTLGIVFPAQLVLDELPLVIIRGDAAGGALIAVGGDEKSGLLLQLGGEAGLDLSLIELGARLQLVWIPLDNGDNAQTAVEPYIRLGVKPAYVRLGLLINLDKPLGFAFDSDGYWGIRLNAGIEF
jgi:hypothetical protein